MTDDVKQAERALEAARTAQIRALSDHASRVEKAERAVNRAKIEKATGGEYVIPDRETLIGICEAAMTSQEVWTDRDSAGAVRQVGECLALLRAGCDYELDMSMYERDPKDIAKTLWVKIEYQGFNWFERPDNDNDYLDSDLFYLPTQARLDANEGKDWY